MSQILTLIHDYLNQLQDLRKFSGTHRESVVREAFKDLLKGVARLHDLKFVPEYEITTPARDRRYVDGALLHALRMPFGYWEAKDEKDDLDAEIEFKFKRGYPQDNIIFEDSTEAVLIQNRREVMRCAVDDISALEKLLNLFFSHERTEIAEFRKAVDQFKTDLPAVLHALRDMIEKEHAQNLAFRGAAQRFLKHAQEVINPSLTDADVREMLIQHILTEEIFSKVFGEDDFHRQNNVAKALYALEETFFTGDLKKRTLRGLATYYAAIRSAADQISSHHEKQTFLKVIYENFYKVYNVKAADRLGVVYTPNEIVRFMIESADWLCEKHFGRTLIDRDVDILDPATGTGTFICELLEHFRGQPAKLKRKYQEELHANEVAILPYYVANLNIEATYAALTGDYLEYANLCFVDTLDNVAGLRKYAGHIDDLFGSVSEENVGRIRRQNSRKISVIIGNPPYNANQLNENENNKNREYPDIDKRIKETYIAESTAQKTKLYDMYARFFRWASDRVDANGILAFITNRSFIESRTFDGFRKIVAGEFNEIYIVDLGGDVRTNPKLSGTKHNVFGIQTGVAISFMVKRAHAGKPVKGCRIYYVRRPEMETAEEKLMHLSASKLQKLPIEEIQPDGKGNWLNQTANDFDQLLPLISKSAKASTRSSGQKVIAKLFANGIKTNRDEWVYEFDDKSLNEKINFFYTELKNHGPESIKRGEFNTVIKWSRDLKLKVQRSQTDTFGNGRIIESMWRPFTKKFFWADKTLSDILTDFHFKIFGREFREQTRCICVCGTSGMKPFQLLAVEGSSDYEFVEKNNMIPFVYVENEQRVENITDWALDQFKKHYQPGRAKPKRPITKESIFHYVYGVLHDPLYREKYALNLRREFPRIPFYPDFWQWADWGRELMELHIGYETVKPWDVTIAHITPSKPPAPRKPDEAGDARFNDPKARLKADKEAGRIVLDDYTTLGGIPPAAWDYKLGNRSALEWILDQYKESKPKDPTIREKFDTYRFADYKDKVIDLLARVTRVSVETQRIVTAMRECKR